MYPVKHVWTVLIIKILQAHLLRAFVANLKIDAIYALYPESFCDKNLAIRKVFAFCDSGVDIMIGNLMTVMTFQPILHHIIQSFWIVLNCWP